MNSMDKFNDLVGLIFGRLYEAFPVPLEVDPNTFHEQAIATNDEEGAFGFSEYFSSTVKWLESAGYIWIEQDKSTMGSPAFDLVLSEQGLEALRRVPTSLEGNASIGERLVEFSKSKASDAIGTLISLAVTTTVQGGVSAS